MKKVSTLFKAAAVAALIPALVGCDAEPDNNDDVISAVLTDRYDTSELAANPGATASMPGNMTSGDLITYMPTAETLTENNVVLPKTDGEADWVLRPSSTGNFVIERQRYIYSSSALSSTIELSPIDRIITATEFDAAMLSLAQSGANRAGSLSSKLTTAKYPIDSAQIFNLTQDEKDSIREAVLSLGYIAVDMPAALAVGRGSKDGVVQIDVDNIVVRRTRQITHTVESTNLDILRDGIIEGTFVLTDTYFDLALEASVGDNFYHVIIARIPTFTENLQVQTIEPAASGTFVLKLGDISNFNPNQ
ncbi:MAG: hypothetical protein AB8F34_15405 [Akkermansiaceae bacterium]